MGSTFFFNWEVDFIYFLQQNMNKFGIFLAETFSTIGSEICAFVVVCFIYWCIDKNYLRKNCLTLSIGLIFCPFLKNLVLRRRPYFDHENIKSLIPVDSEADLLDISAQGYSFPSMHSSNSVTVYTACSIIYKKKVSIIVGILLPLLIGISRIATGNHYPTDVLAGWAIGLVAIFIGQFLSSKIKKETQFNFIFLAIASVGLFICTSNDFFTCYGLVTGFFVGLEFERHLVWHTSKNFTLNVIRFIVGFIIIGITYGFFKLPIFDVIEGSKIFRVVRYAMVGFVATAIAPLAFTKIPFLKKMDD